MANIGPLTTTFTAPEGCASGSGVTRMWLSEQPYYFVGARDTSCFPSGFATDTEHFYSPG